MQLSVSEFIHVVCLFDCVYLVEDDSMDKAQ